MLEEHGHHSQRSKCKAEIIIHLSQEEREIIVRSISIEAEEIPSKRTRVEVNEVDKGIQITVYAEDIVALRAALNSFLRFVDASLRSIRILYSIESSQEPS
ncbi:MAG: KEOPS complex subunit Pcc1 [Aigarchaeota archaeon]|nr:KEOPS complex subunit Pcc1 [Aigarchaeota archaeon]MCX8193625.1 KEOPS complex subunit Pcc1 [Nitrososphaeria archaeon]MDW7987025.1 KEOPS complex subunit Pcc1 [Nitrososphaerota archaeon]